MTEIKQKQPILTLEDILKLFKETDKRFKETDERFKETDERLDKRIKETDERFKEVAVEFKEVAEGFKETKQIVKETSKTVGSLGNTWGEFVEGLVAPAALRLFREKGYAVQHIHPRLKAPLDGREMEIDILVIDGDFVILIEAKSKVKRKDVDDHIKRLSEFKNFFPTYKKNKALGAIAGIVFEKGVDIYAQNKGLFTIEQKGDTVQISNNNEFKAREW